MSSKAKPLISANMVTAMRLLAMPLLAWLLYRSPMGGYGNASWWWALTVGTIIGCTDFVDGWLARKYGPTVLGGMLDPLADKVFVALVYLPLMHLGYFPTLAVGLLFIREFLVTSIRSAYEWRGLQLKTSYFGKVKTWVQMQGILFFVLAALIPKDTFVKILIAGSFAPVIAVAVYWFGKGAFSRNNAWATFFMAIVVGIFAIPESMATSIEISLYIVCAVTWLSGLDYLLGALPTLHKAGGFHRADLARLLAAIAVPVSCVVAMSETSAPAAPILLVFAGELAVGGLDNLLSRHKSSASAQSVVFRSLGSAALLFACVIFKEQAELLAWIAMGLSLTGVAYEFWRGRSHYLDDDKWDEELVAEAE